MNIEDKFESVNDDYLKFDRVLNKISNRPDVHAFILLDKLFPDNQDIISRSHHDEFYLSMSTEQIETLTDEQILELVRCGVRYDSECECLCMFA